MKRTLKNAAISMEFLSTNYVLTFLSTILIAMKKVYMNEKTNKHTQ